MDTCPFCDLDESFHVEEIKDGESVLRCHPDRMVGHIKACLALSADLGFDMVTEEVTN